MRVLYVEDNEDVRDLMSDILLDDGIDFVACADGEAAELVFAEGRFDVLLTDVSLPRLSGTELARRLLDRQPDLWVIFLSGYVLGDLQSWGPRVHALLKPFETAELAAILEAARAGTATA